MTVFVDTSALYALASRTDARHLDARKIYERLLGEETPLITSSYVLVETLALVQSRLGLSVARLVASGVASEYEIVWVDEGLHREGWSEVSKQGSRAVSLVDCVSFAVMRQRGLNTAFAFDLHFTSAGFELCTPL